MHKKQKQRPAHENKDAEPSVDQAIGGVKSDFPASAPLDDISVLGRLEAIQLVMKDGQIHRSTL